MNAKSRSGHFPTDNPRTVKHVSIITLVCLLMVASSSVSGRTAIGELYGELRSFLKKPIEVEYSAISDFEVADSELLDYVSAALFSDDSEKVDEILVELFNYALSVNVHRWLNTQPPPIRNFSSEPGLRDFLIQLWFFEQEKLESELKSYEEVRLPWSRIPKILVVLFPRDREVHDFIWSIHNTLEPTEPAATLMLLDSGEFQTPKANNLRIATLTSDGPEIFRLIAARSLGRFQSTEGFETLLATLRDSDNRSLVAVVIEAIILHGYSVLPYAQEIREVAERFGVDEDTKLAVLTDHIVFPTPYDLTFFGEDASTNRFVSAHRDLERMTVNQSKLQARAEEPQP
ncbi:MAG: HEAT repeat domain-containing protein [Gammaproteobacteria bacterium]|nr:HEAT repeat domain-containing protein [Gammaproteobacteria bacterium]